MGDSGGLAAGSADAVGGALHVSRRHTGAVGKSSIARGDLMETWQKSEEEAHQGQDYQKIRLEKTMFRGNPAVVWEYTFTLKGVPWHARLLGFDQEGKSYQINTWYQPEDEAQALKTYGRSRTASRCCDTRRGPRRSPRAPPTADVGS